jgi:putative DNA primase/helicase
MSQISNNLRAYQSYLNDLMITDTESIEIHEANLKTASMLYKSINKARYVKECRNIFCYLMQEEEFVGKLNSNPDILAVKNGNLDLRTGKLQLRTIEDYNSFKINTAYNPNADTSNIEKFMDDIMIGQTDIIAFLKKLLGYSITGHITEQNFAVFYGENGSNGKSVLSKLFTKTFDNYVTTLDAEIFSNKKGNAGTATTHLNYVQNKRCGILDESDKKQEMNEGLIKRITGGTKLRIRKLQKESEEIEVKMTPILCTNFLPNFSNDPALHRRMLMIEFEARFLAEDHEDYNPENPRHKLIVLDIEDKISKEEILLYFTQGAMEWYQTGLKNVPEKIKNYNKEFKSSCNKFKQFLKISAIPAKENESVFTPFRQLYEAYCTFAHPEKININDFKTMVEKNGYKEIIEDDISGYAIKLKEEIY